MATIFKVLTWQGTKCRHDTHSQHTSAPYSLFTSAERTHNALGSRIALSSLCAWKESSHLVSHMSHPCWLLHMPFTTSTSSSSFTLPSITQEHAAQSVQHDPLQKHSVHPAHLQAPLVDKLRHQESLWLEDLQNGGNPRTTTATFYEPKELATVLRIEAYSGDPYHFLMYMKKLGKKINELRSPKKWRNLERLGRPAYRFFSKYQRRPASNLRCFSTIPWEALQILIFKIESCKRCWLHHCMPRKLRENPMQWSCRRER